VCRFFPPRAEGKEREKVVTREVTRPFDEGESELSPSLTPSRSHPVVSHQLLLRSSPQFTLFRLIRPSHLDILQCEVRSHQPVDR
jgi:hypothetical protein